jgi:hypothetical protein
MSGLADHLANNVTGADALGHLHALQRIADAHDGNRAPGTPGFATSAAYALGVLTTAGYQVTRQEVPCMRFVVAAERTQVAGAGWCPRTLLMDDSPLLYDAVAPLIVIPDAVQPGEYAQWVTPGAVVLLARVPGGYDRQVAAASDAGAAAVLLYVSTPCPGNIYRLHWYRADPPPIPLASLSQHDAGRLAALAREARVELSLHWRGCRVADVTQNILAVGGTDDGGGARVIVGAHLDSVAEAPGINDNGSGVAAVMQTAVKLASAGRPVRNMVTFALWGAEELVNVGSSFYVSQLSYAERQEILVYLNAEMIASPNYAMYVMQGDGVVTAPFEAYFRGHGIDYEYASTGAVGSDHQPFQAAGIPVGGLHCGSIGIKTPGQRQRYAGQAGQLYDPGYHQAGDTVHNISREALDCNTRALAYAVGWAAETDRLPASVEVP